MSAADPHATRSSTTGRNFASFGVGTLIGALGGLIGLGGAEFRLPLLIGYFRFAALEAIILNKAMSLVVVAFALPFRFGAVPWTDVVAQWPIILNLLAGSLLGAWFGASWTTRVRGKRLYSVLALLLLLMAAVLAFGHGHVASEPLLSGGAQWVGGVVAGFGIGVVAAILGVAGGELLIPTLVILFAADIKLAGSLSLAVSLPTMVVSFARYSRDRSFAAIGRHRRFVLVMAAGSVVGVWLGGMLLGIVPDSVLIPALAIILVISAWKVWGHRNDHEQGSAA